MDKDAIIKQADEFKKKYGEYPKYPIRVRYKWMTNYAEGNLEGPQIFGYPGIVGAVDREVTELVMLYDADKRNFPRHDEELATTKKKEEALLKQKPVAVLSKEDLDDLKKIFREAQTTPAIFGAGFDMAGSAWDRVREKQKQLAKKYGYEFNKGVINSHTGEVYLQELKH